MAEMTFPVFLTRAELGILLVLSFHGWGALGERIMGVPREKRGSIVDHGTLGMAIALALGAVLNDLHLLHRVVYLALLGTGLGYQAFDWIPRFQNRLTDGKWLLIFAVVALIATPVYFDSLDGGNFNHHDDYYSYLVAPARINQLGTLQVDAFNYRQVASGPGGMPFLQAPIIDFCGVTAARLLDQGVGVLLLIGATATLFRRMRVAALPAIMLAAGAVILVQHQLVNITSYFTTLALLVALAALQLDSDDDSCARPMAAALLLAGVAALKNIAVPFAGLQCVMILVDDFRRRRPLVLRNAVVMGVIFIAVMGAWYLPRAFALRVHLIHLRFGDGPDEASIHYMLYYTFYSVWHWVYIVAFLILCAPLLCLSQFRMHRAVVMRVSVAVIVASLVIAYGTGGANPRYTQFVVLIGYLFCGGILLSEVRSSAFSFLLAVPICMGFLVFRPSDPVKWYAQYCGDMVARITRPLPYDYPTAQQIQTIQSVQASMTPGSRALVCVASPFLLDFQRNRLFIVDFPRAASPAPGIPDERNVAGFVRYLRRQGIRYIVYGYADEAGFTDALVESRLRLPWFPPWGRALNKQVPIFHRQLMAVGARWPRVYDDGKTFVVDLSG